LRGSQADADRGPDCDRSHNASAGRQICAREALTAKSRQVLGRRPLSSSGPGR
jgi:hypothetical protein